ncbi:MAG: GumC family protein [Deltaproteobacteria bacterium]|nr:GumC family protein [Deltaproteobacteria bacterium]
MTRSGNEQTINLTEYYRVLTRHKLLIALCFIGGLSLAFWYNSNLIPLYRATATIVIDKESRYSPLTGARMGFESYLSESMTFNTHFELILSRPVLEQVVKDMKMDAIYKGSDEKKRVEAHPLRQLFSRIKKNISLLLGGKKKVLATRKVIDPEERLLGLAQRVKGMISVKPVEDTRLVTLNALSPSPTEARDVVNALARAYIDFNLKTKLQASKNTLEWLTDNLYRTKEKLNDAEEAFLAYKQSANLISLENSQTTIGKKITDFNDAYIQARNRRLELSAKLAELERISKSRKNIPHFRSLIGSALIDDLYGQLVKAEGERSRLEKIYKSKHHKIIAINARIADTRSKLRLEIQKEMENLKAEQALMKNKEKIIQRTISDFKKEAMDINKQELQYGILKRNLDLNRELYDTIMSKLKESSITADVDVSNIRLMEKALLPMAPIGPNKKRNLVLGIFLGLMAGLGLSFLLEYLDRTLHTEDDVQNYLGLPVLSVIPLGRKAKQKAYGNKDEA